MKSRSRSLEGSTPDPAVHYSRVPIPRLIFCMRTESVGQERKKGILHKGEKVGGKNFLPSTNTFLRLLRASVCSTAGFPVVFFPIMEEDER